MTTTILEDKKELPDTPEIKLLAVIVREYERLLAMANFQLESEVKKVHNECAHEFELLTIYDADYCGRLDNIGRGQDVFVGQKCKKCKLFVPRKKGYPWQICYKCGGEMKHDRCEQFGMDRAHVHKCQSCGHEHDTT